MDAQQSTLRLAYSINEAAAALSISRRSVYAMIAAGRLHAIRLGARQRVPASELERLLSADGRPAAAAPIPVAAVVEAQVSAPRRPDEAADDRDDGVRVPKPKLSDLIGAMQKARSSG